MLRSAAIRCGSALEAVYLARDVRPLELFCRLNAVPRVAPAPRRVSEVPVAAALRVPPAADVRVVLPDREDPAALRDPLAFELARFRGCAADVRPAVAFCDRAVDARDRLPRAPLRRPLDACAVSRLTSLLKLLF